MKALSSKEGVPARKVLSKDNLIIKGIPVSYVGYTLKDFKASTEKFNFYRTYLENLHSMYKDRVCIFQTGANGTGKTLLASLVVKEGYRLRYNTYMTTLASYISLLFKANKSFEEEKLLRYIKNCDFLVLDEVGKENFTSTKSNINVLEELLRTATQTGQVIIINTNLVLKDFEELYGASITSLIKGDFTILKFKGEDYRPVVKRNSSRELLARALKC